MRESDVRERAFAMPLTSPAYPPGPYRFVNREHLIITYRTDLEKLRALAPKPLVPDAASSNASSSACPHPHSRPNRRQARLPRHGRRPTELRDGGNRLCLRLRPLPWPLCDLARGKRLCGSPENVQGVTEDSPALEPRVRLATPHGDRPHIVFGIEHLENGLDMNHTLGEAFAFFLVFENLPAEFGVKAFKSELGLGCGDLGFHAGVSIPRQSRGL